MQATVFMNSDQREQIALKFSNGFSDKFLTGEVDKYQRNFVLVPT